jgi:hypothetical protein
MKKLIIIALMLFIPFISQAGCREPKAVTVCHRECCYNYWGPGAHCTEVCTRQILSH